MDIMRTFESYDCEVGPPGSPSRDCIVEESDITQRVGIPGSGLVEERSGINLGEWEDGFDMHVPKYTPTESERSKCRKILRPCGDCIRCKKTESCIRFYEQYGCANYEVLWRMRR